MVDQNLNVSMITLNEHNLLTNNIRIDWNIKYHIETDYFNAV